MSSARASGKGADSRSSSARLADWRWTALAVYHDAWRTNWVRTVRFVSSLIVGASEGVPGGRANLGGVIPP